jgi:hypothetical protein
MRHRGYGGHRIGRSGRPSGRVRPRHAASEPQTAQRHQQLLSRSFLRIAGRILTTVAVARGVLTTASRTLLDPAIDNVQLADRSAAISARVGLLVQPGTHGAIRIVKRASNRATEMTGSITPKGSICVALCSVWNQKVIATFDDHPSFVGHRLAECLPMDRLDLPEFNQSQS